MAEAAKATKAEVKAAAEAADAAKAKTAADAAADAKAKEEAKIATAVKKKEDDADHLQRHSALDRLSQLRGENAGLTAQVEDYKKDITKAQAELEKYQGAAMQATTAIATAEDACQANGRKASEITAVKNQARDLTTLEGECQVKVKELTARLDAVDKIWRTKKVEAREHFDKQDRYHHEEVERKKAEKEAQVRAAAAKAAADVERANEIKYARRFDQQVVIENKDTGSAVLERMERKMMSERGGTSWFAERAAASILGQAESVLPPKEYASWPDWRKNKWDWQHGVSREEEHGEKGLYDQQWHSKGHEALAKDSKGKTLAYEQHTY